MYQDNLLLAHIELAASVVILLAVGEDQVFLESPAAFCNQTPTNFMWDWVGRIGPMPFRSSHEVCAFQGDGLT